MDIVIRSVNRDMVGFDSAIGCGIIARWNGKLPNIDQRYHVEIDINDKFEWGKNIFSVEEDTPSTINMDGSMLMFVAKVISCESDGILTVSLDNDIILIETSFLSKGNINYVLFYTCDTNVVLYSVDL